ncbi:MAG: RDD family protein [Luteimonas sp.]
MAERADDDAVPAGFLAREAAWSLDAMVVAIATALLTWTTVTSALATLQQAWRQLQEVVAARMAEALTQVTDPAGLVSQLLRDPALRVAAATAESALYGALLPPLLVFAALAAGYWISFERSAWQATPGKRALGLQVTDLGGQRLGLARAAARHVAGALSWLTLNLGHALAAVPTQKRALHDYIAGTRVVVHGDHDPRLPGWAKAWIALQLLLAVGLPVWLVLRYAAELQTGMLQTSLLQG